MSGAASHAIPADETPARRPVPGPFTLNAVMLKELRQAVRGRLVSGGMIALLCLLVLAIGLFVAMYSIQASMGDDESRDLGTVLFGMLIGALTAASVVFVPAYVGIRTAIERAGAQMDLLYATILTPGQIVRGKFLAGAAIAALFYSLCLPFMGLTFLLRGVDVLTILMSTALSFTLVMAVTMLGVCLGALPLSPLAKVTGTVLLFGYLVSRAMFLIEYCFEALRYGFHGGRSYPYGGYYGGYLGSPATSLFVFWCLLVLATSLLYVVAVSLLTQRGADYARPVRIHFAAVWVVFLGVLAVLSLGSASAPASGFLPAVVFPAAVVIVTLLALGLPAVVSEPDRLTTRMALERPKPRWLRRAAFFFQTGAAGGLIWAVLIAAATLFLLPPMEAATLPGGAGPEFRERWTMLGGSSLYALAYILTGLWIRHTLLERICPAKHTWVVIALTAALVLNGSIIVFAFVSADFDHINQHFVFGSPYWMDAPAWRDVHMLAASLWVAGMLALNARWMSRQYRDYVTDR